MVRKRSGDKRRRMWEMRKTWVWPWKLIGNIRFRAIFKNPNFGSF